MPTNDPTGPIVINKSSWHFKLYQSHKNGRYIGTDYRSVTMRRYLIDCGVSAMAAASFYSMIPLAVPVIIAYDTAERIKTRMDRTSFGVEIIVAPAGALTLLFIGICGINPIAKAYGLICIYVLLWGLAAFGWIGLTKIFVNFVEFLADIIDERLPAGFLDRQVQF